jgi:hypothetical protein
VSSNRDAAIECIEMFVDPGVDMFPCVDVGRDIPFAEISSALPSVYVCDSIDVQDGIFESVPGFTIKIGDTMFHCCGKYGYYGDVPMILERIVLLILNLVIDCRVIKFKIVRDDLKLATGKGGADLEQVFH